MSSPVIGKEIDKQNEIIEHLAKTQNFYFFDLANYSSQFKDLNTDEVHLNTQGNQLKAKILSNFLKDSIFINRLVHE